MKYPETPLILKTEILTASDKWLSGSDEDYRQLLKTLGQIPHEVIAEGIFQVFEETSRPDQMYTDQKLSGYILQEIRPVYKGDALELINRLINTWNKSLSDLPEWFLENYGETELTTALAGFDTENCTEAVADNFRTFRWWLRL